MPRDPRFADQPTVGDDLVALWDVHQVFSR